MDRTYEHCPNTSPWSTSSQKHWMREVLLFMYLVLKETRTDNLLGFLRQLVRFSTFMGLIGKDFEVSVCNLRNENPCFYNSATLIYASFSFYITWLASCFYETRNRDAINEACVCNACFDSPTNVHSWKDSNFVNIIMLQKRVKTPTLRRVRVCVFVWAFSTCNPYFHFCLIDSIIAS